MDWLPERDHHEALKTDRLIKLGGLFRAVWLRCSELHEADAGDDTWSLSCRAFRRSCFKLSIARNDWPWLSISERRKMQLVLAVGIIPVRFFHGDADEIPKKYSRATDAEDVLRQGVLNLDDRVRAGELLRFAVDTTSVGVPLTIKLVLYEEYSGEIIQSFVIPEVGAAGKVVERFPKPKPTPGVVQPVPIGKPRTGRVKDNKDSGE